MSEQRHHAIIITADSLLGRDILARAQQIAVQLGCQTTPIFVTKVNGVQSFAVLPDGSFENWDESDEGDKQRTKLIEWLNAQRYAEDDGGSPLSWIEVYYGYRAGWEPYAGIGRTEESDRKPGTLTWEMPSAIQPAEVTTKEET